MGDDIDKSCFITSKMNNSNEWQMPTFGFQRQFYKTTDYPSKQDAWIINLLLK